MNNIKIVYVDDNLDASLSRFLDEEYRCADVVVESEDVLFDVEQSYESLICDERIKTANVIIVDSKLFEDRTVSGIKFTGEEFKLLVKNYYPYIEVIVITQNDVIQEYGIDVPKWKSNNGESSKEFYATHLSPVIDASIKAITINRNLGDKIKSNEEIDAFIVEKIINSLEGRGKYDELTKSDISELIVTFKELQGKIK